MAPETSLIVTRRCQNEQIDKQFEKMLSALDHHDFADYLPFKYKTAAPGVYR